MVAISSVELTRLYAVNDGEAERVEAKRLDDLLSSWHGWCAGHSVVHGFPTVNAACRSALASRQYDDQNGGLDAHIDAVLMEAVDAVVDAIADPWRAALSTQARNLWAGSQVWSNPRLPSCRMARALLVADARKRFHDGLASAGLL